MEENSEDIWSTWFTFDQPQYHLLEVIPYFRTSLHNLKSLLFNNFAIKIGKKSFGVRPIFTSIEGVNMLVDKAADENRVPSLYARKQASDMPSWIVLDKQVCPYNLIRTHTNSQVKQ